MPLLVGMPRKNQPDLEIESYYKHLEAELEALPHETKDACRNEIEKVGIKKANLTWDDLLELELLLIKILPSEKLDRKAWKIRERYQAAAGGKDYREYLRSKPPALEGPPKDPAEVQKLRADLEVVLEDLFWRYRLMTIWEEKRNVLFQRFFIGYALVIVASIATLATWDLWSGSVTLRAIFTVLAVAAAGAGGGLISMVQRLQSLPDNRKRTGSLIELEHGSTGLVFQALITGGVFATVLFLMLGSGVVRVDLFPEFDMKAGFLGWLASPMKQGGQFAIVLLWSFLAGFAERLVPDFLDGIRKGRTTPSAPRKEKEPAAETPPIETADK